MGKARKAPIALAFVVGGAVAYQFTAPPAKTNQGFSFARLFNSARQKMQADKRIAGVVCRPRHAPPPRRTSSRTAAWPLQPRHHGRWRSPRGHKFRPEDRLDGARRADRALVCQTNDAGERDDLGSALVISADYPLEGSQSSELTIHVPERLAVRLDNSASGHVHLSNLAAGVRFENSSGEDDARSSIGDAVTGQFRAAATPRDREARPPST